jgi:hypothetical protein
MGWNAMVVREQADRPYGSHSIDPDVAEAMGDELVVLSANIEAATQRFLLVLAEFDRLRCWELSGQASTAHWLALRCGIDRGTAREKVRTARALVALPLTSAAMGRGELSFSQVKTLTRAATAENEGELLALARGTSVHLLERMIRAWKKGNRQDEIERERELHESRRLSIFPDDEGGYAIRGRLTPEVGALLMRVIEAASDALYRESPNPLATEEERHREAAQRRADAMGLVAERALAAGFGRGSAADGDDTDCAHAAATGAGTEVGEGTAAPISGTRAERYQVVLHVDAETLSEQGEPGRSGLDDGTRVACETSRRLACDASLVRVARQSGGSALAVGRKARTIPPALRRALEIRDCGCRFPGCGLRFTDAHHLKHWADGGATTYENCLLLCRHHHRLVHEGGWRVGWDGEGRPIFFDRRGHPHYEGAWQRPALPEDAVEALLAENERLGIKPDPWTPNTPWERERDIPKQVYFDATERM